MRAFFDSDLWYSFSRSPVTVLSAIVAFVCVAGAAFAPWLAPHLTRAEPSVMEHLPGIHDRQGDLIGAVVGLQFSEPLAVSGTFPVVVKDERADWDDAEIREQTIEQKVSLVVVVVSFRDDRALGLWYWG